MAILAAEMASIKAVAKKRGIPERTLRSWLESPMYAELRAKTREDMANEAHVMAQLALAQIRARLPEYEPRDLSVLYGIMIDKAQLLAGQATNRTETKDITSRFSDHEMDMLADAIDDEIKRRETVPA